MQPNQPPLNERELRIVRGMIDEYTYDIARRRIVSGWFGDIRMTIAFAGGGILLVTNIVGLVFLLTGNH